MEKVNAGRRRKQEAELLQLCANPQQSHQLKRENDSLVLGTNVSCWYRRITDGVKVLTSPVPQCSVSI